MTKRGATSLSNVDFKLNRREAAGTLTPLKTVSEEAKDKKKVPRESAGRTTEKTYRCCIQKVNDRLSHIRRHKQSRERVSRDESSAVPGAGGLGGAPVLARAAARPRLQTADAHRATRGLRGQCADVEARRSWLLRHGAESQELVRGEQQRREV